MQEKSESLQWLVNWYRSRCDGVWEHSYGVTIETIDNPGWSVLIEVSETPIENLELIFNSKQVGDEDDWYGYSVKETVFKGVGDPTKLDVLIAAFRAIWEEHVAR